MMLPMSVLAMELIKLAESAAVSSVQLPACKSIPAAARGAIRLAIKRHNLLIVSSF
jgi:hypothetical protein